MSDNERAVRVVIADDDGDIRALVKISVAKAGLNVVADVADGEAALAAITEHVPDLAILDISMPGLTGIEVCRKVRENPALAGVRVLLLTAAVDDKTRQIGLNAGATDYLFKPFSPRALVASLAEHAGGLQ